MRTSALAILITIVASAQVQAAGKLNYGSRAGMTVTVISMSGINGRNAIIKTQHTRDDAIGYCKEYVQRVDEECIRRELNIPLSNQISADCKTGRFSTFFGGNFQFLGRNKTKTTNLGLSFLIRNLSSGQIADGSSASGYPTNIELFGALCPALGPFDR
jgi:hypothetical protein